MSKLPNAELAAGISSVTTLKTLTDGNIISGGVAAKTSRI
jgi:hypothetical protein